MVTFSSSWTEDQSITFDDTTPAKTVEGKADIDFANLGAISAIIQFEITFGDAADGNAEIRIRNSCDSGTKKDTILLHEQEVSFTVSTTKRVSVVFVEAPPYIEVGVYNGNTAVQDITIAAKYAYKKYVSA